MLRMTEDAIQPEQQHQGTKECRNLEADPAMQILDHEDSAIVLWMSRKTGTAIKILKTAAEKTSDGYWQIWLILMSRKNMEIAGMIWI